VVGAKSELCKDAGSKAWWAKPRPEDAAERRFAAPDYPQPVLLPQEEQV